MVKRIPNLFLILMLIIVALACVAPAGVTTPDPNFINMAIAQTQTAAHGIPITGQESLTPTLTRAPSATPFPTFTVVVIGAPQLRVSEDTICRTGPGASYDRVGVLRAGGVAEVVGRSADGSFWVIRNPDRAGEICWISGENATLSGVTGLLPVFASPPTPTATNTRVPSSTPTRTPSPTFTPSNTPTHTLTPSSTATSTLTSSPTSSFTPTSTGTSSILTPTPSFTPTSTGTASTPTPTSSFTPTSTGTASTPTASPTLSPTPTSTSTSTSTATFTPSPTSTPSPTATPLSGFAASYSGMDSCTGTGWWVELALENIGGTSFESMAVILIDQTTATVLPFDSEDFTNRDGCNTSNTQTNLPPAVTHIVSMPVFSSDPTAHNLRATIVLCSNPGRSGLCLAETINFIP